MKRSTSKKQNFNLRNKMLATKSISNTTLNKWNEDDERRWRVVERQKKLDQTDISSKTKSEVTTHKEVSIKLFQSSSFL